MESVQSRDGARIVFERVGQGPPVILIGGALNDRRARAAGTPLAALLASAHTVICYDRRGCGDSAASPPYAVEDEVADLAALSAAVGGRAALYGMSSGGVLALAAATHGLAVDKLAIYEAPLRSDAPSSISDELDGFVAAGERGAAVDAFLTRVVQVPPPVVHGMRKAPFWPALEALAPTLGHNVRLATRAPSLLASARALNVPTCVLAGAASPPWMRDGNRALADAIPDARYVELAGQTHDVEPAVLADALRAFLG